MKAETMLIVHADDLGLTKSVSRGIMRAHNAGIVTSTSVMPNLVTESELELLRAMPSLDIGVHLTITKGSCVLPWEEIPNLVDELGRFHSRGSKNRPVRDGIIDFIGVAEEEILVECEAQIFRLRNAGLRLSHMDTHHHAHLNPIVLGAVIHLAREYGLCVRGINDAMRRNLRDEGIRTSDYFEEKFFGADSITSENLERIIQSLPEGITELMCHPGELSDELNRVSGYVAEREQELKVLTSSESAKTVKASGIHLIGWREIML